MVPVSRYTIRPVGFHKQPRRAGWVIVELRDGRWWRVAKFPTRWVAWERLMMASSEPCRIAPRDTRSGAVGNV
jgi:hypothetical protein